MPQFPEQNVNNALILPAGLDDTSAAGTDRVQVSEQCSNIRAEFRIPEVSDGSDNNSNLKVKHAD